MARIKLADELDPPSPPSGDKWTVAKVRDVYLADLHPSANSAWAVQVERWLNDLCGYCGALTVSEFRKKHLRTWLQRHTTWNHNSQRNVIASITRISRASDQKNLCQTNPCFTVVARDQMNSSSVSVVWQK